ncbi:FMRFamide receptor [Aplysia californica]|uniref:FMRFamide receptor n=1 Tax=Aplysia californica TaxID=6500 RepID=A0ABM1AEF4_APLCA|nr:FMRFamide receptor [Aplysia californica]
MTEQEPPLSFGGMAGEAGLGVDLALYNNYSTSDFWADTDDSDLLSMLNTLRRGPPDIDSEQQIFRNRLTYYLMGIGGSTVCCLGTIANALSVAVLTRRAMRSSTYMYLAALAICDSLVLFFTLLLILKDTRPPDSPHHLEQFHAVLFPFIHPTAVVFQVTSVWLTLAFTVDRYIMICHPFKAERMCRRSRARKVVVGIYVGGLIFNIPKYLEYYTKSEDFRLSNSSEVYTIYGIETTELGKNEIFREFIHSWMYLVCVCGIPFFTLVVLNAFLIRAVHLSRLKGKELNAREKHRNDTTVMLIGVIIIFLICQGPALVSRMIYAFNPISTKDKNIFTLNEVGSFLVILNSAINIVPYYLFGRKFRSEFWRLFCTCFFDKDELRRIVRSYSNSIDHRRMSQYNGMEMNGMAVNNCNMDRDFNIRGLNGLPPIPGEVPEGGKDRVYTCYMDQNQQRYGAGRGVSGGGGGAAAAAASPSSTSFSCIAGGGGGGGGCSGDSGGFAVASSSSSSLMRKSDTCDSVAVPLIHSTSGVAPTTNSLPSYSSLYADGSTGANQEQQQQQGHVIGRHVTTSGSRESLRDPAVCHTSSMSRSSSIQQSSPQTSRAVSNGHVQYMTVSSGPNVSEPVWSAV